MRKKKRKVRMIEGEVYLWTEDVTKVHGPWSLGFIIMELGTKWILSLTYFHNVGCRLLHLHFIVLSRANSNRFLTLLFVIDNRDGNLDIFFNFGDNSSRVFLVLDGSASGFERSERRERERRGRRDRGIGRIIHLEGSQSQKTQSWWISSWCRGWAGRRKRGKRERRERERFEGERFTGAVQCGQHGVGWWIRKRWIIVVRRGLELMWHGRRGRRRPAGIGRWNTRGRSRRRWWWWGWIMCRRRWKILWWWSLGLHSIVEYRNRGVGIEKLVLYFKLV
jgi:hypothetical protein